MSAPRTQFLVVDAIVPESALTRYNQNNAAELVAANERAQTQRAAAAGAGLASIAGMLAGAGGVGSGYMATAATNMQVGDDKATYFLKSIPPSCIQSTQLRTFGQINHDGDLADYKKPPAGFKAVKFLVNVSELTPDGISKAESAIRQHGVNSSDNQCISVYTTKAALNSRLIAKPVDQHLSASGGYNEWDQRTDADKALGTRALPDLVSDPSYSTHIAKRQQTEQLAAHDAKKAADEKPSQYVCFVKKGSLSGKKSKLPGCDGIVGIARDLPGDSGLKREGQSDFVILQPGDNNFDRIRQEAKDQGYEPVFFLSNKSLDQLKAEGTGLGLGADGRDRDRVNPQGHVIAVTTASAPYATGQLEQYIKVGKGHYDPLLGGRLNNAWSDKDFKANPLAQLREMDRLLDRQPDQNADIQSLSQQVKAFIHKPSTLSNLAARSTFEKTIAPLPTDRGKTAIEALWEKIKSTFDKSAGLSAKIGQFMSKRGAHKDPPRQDPSSHRPGGR